MRGIPRDALVTPVDAEIIINHKQVNEKPQEKERILGPHWRTRRPPEGRVLEIEIAGQTGIFRAIPVYEIGWDKYHWECGNQRIPKDKVVHWREIHGE